MTWGILLIPTVLFFIYGASKQCDSLIEKYVSGCYYSVAGTALLIAIYFSWKYLHETYPKKLYWGLFGAAFWGAIASIGNLKKGGAAWGDTLRFSALMFVLYFFFANGCSNNLSRDTESPPGCESLPGIYGC